jgi:glycogen synthase
MRILLVASSYRPQIGGLQTAVEQLARAFGEHGNRVMITTNRYPHSLASREVLHGVPVIRLLFHFPRFEYLRTGRLDLWLAGVLFFPATLLRFVILLKNFSPDIVNLHYVGSPTLFILAGRALRSFPLVVSLHGGDVDAEPQRNRLNRYLFRAIVRRAAVVTSCSDFLADLAAQIEPSVAEKCVVIRNGVDIDLFSKAAPHKQDRPYLFCVGQLEFHKGFDLVISAFARLAHSVPTVDLLLGGGGGQEQELVDQVRRMHLESRVKFLGRLGSEQVASLMKGSRGVIIPSRREPLGIVALEARVANTEIIASRVGGLVEALEGYPVSWVRPGDVDDLHRAMALLVAQGTQRQKDGMTSPLRIGNVPTWKDSAERFLALYKEAL